MDTIFMIIGGLLPTFLFSRLFLWLMKTWDGGVRKIFVVHGVSLLAATLLAGMGLADKGTFSPILALTIYIIPQGVWLLVDIFKNNRKKKAVENNVNDSVPNKSLKDAP